MERSLELEQYSLELEKLSGNKNLLNVNKCDKYDYLISVCSGVLAGLIDSFFVGSPLTSSLGKVSDGMVDKVVIKFAKTMGWKGKNDNNIANAINFLEGRFKVNYDQAHTQAVNGVFNMAAKNHHMKSLGHSPSVVGLFFSIIDQFNGTSHFIDSGRLIKINVENQNLSLYGNNFLAKVFCGFVNWIGHIMSDIAGSYGARLKGNRGSGLVMPFTELLQFCNVGSFTNKKEKLDFANTMIKVFENGYDFRFGVTMAIPVILNELTIRTFWVIKRRFYKNIEWKDCIPTTNHSDLRMMLLISNAALCVTDGLDSVIRSNGNVVEFISRFNIIAWGRLVMLVFKELRIRYGNIVIELRKEFVDYFDLSDAKKINAYYERINTLDNNLQIELTIFIEEVNKETQYIESTVDFLLDDKNTADEKMIKRIECSKHVGVKDEKIVKNLSDVDDFFLM